MKEVSAPHVVRTPVMCMAQKRKGKYCSFLLAELIIDCMFCSVLLIKEHISAFQDKSEDNNVMPSNFLQLSENEPLGLLFRRYDPVLREMVLVDADKNKVVKICSSSMLLFCPNAIN